MSLSLEAAARMAGLTVETVRLWSRTFGFPTPGAEELAREEADELRVVAQLVGQGWTPPEAIRAIVHPASAGEGERPFARHDSIERARWSARMSERRYRIQKASELSGVSEELIRAWERRYAVIAPERTEGGFRLYSDADVELLRRLRRLTREGLPIGEATRLVPQLREEILQQREAGPPTGADVPQVEAWRAEILAGAESRDVQRSIRALDEALSALPQLRVFDEVVIPALREVGERWHRGALDVAQEHLVTQVLRGRMLSLLHGAPAGGSAHVVCACFPQEQHEIGALGAALRMRHLGMRVSFLGQRTPADALGRFVKSTGARGVALSCVDDPGGETMGETLDALKGALPARVRVLVGGRGAEVHGDAVERRGFRIFRNDWDEALSWLAELPPSARGGVGTHP